MAPSSAHSASSRVQRVLLLLLDRDDALAEGDQRQAQHLPAGNAEWDTDDREARLVITIASRAGKARPVDPQALS